MNKLIASAAAILLSCTALTMTSVSAADSAEVYVTIADASGKLALIQEKVTVTDTDGDGALTINDALYLAHEAAYSGGAASGYAAEETDYGLSLVKLWGTENGGAFGYYINNSSCWSMTDAVDDGDFVNAFVYTDTAGFSDAFAWFDTARTSAASGQEITLTLNRAGYDADWNPVTLPVEGAVITIDGNDTEYKTDANGKVTFPLSAVGENVISAHADALTLVPPAAVITVEGTETPAETTTTAAATTTASRSTTTANAGTTTTAASAALPDTRDASGAYAAIVLAGAAAAAAVLAISHKHEE